MRPLDFLHLHFKDLQLLSMSGGQLFDLSLKATLDLCLLFLLLLKLVLKGVHSLVQVCDSLILHVSFRSQKYLCILISLLVNLDLSPHRFNLRNTMLKHFLHLIKLRLELDLKLSDLRFAHFGQTLQLRIL
jgi:hypothetical protein